jgi:ribonuclease HI
MKTLLTLTVLSLSTVSGYAQLLTEAEILAEIKNYCEVQRSIIAKSEVECSQVAGYEQSAYNSCVDSLVKTRMTKCVNEVQRSRELLASIL